MAWTGPEANTNVEIVGPYLHPSCLGLLIVCYALTFPDILPSVYREPIFICSYTNPNRTDTGQTLTIYDV